MRGDPPRQWSARCPPEFVLWSVLEIVSRSAANVDRMLTEPFQVEGAPTGGGDEPAVEVGV
jgi:hypothetical protein